MQDWLAIAGGIVLALNLLKLLFDLVPKLGALKSDIYRAASSRIRHRSLEKRAIAADIENVVNTAISSLTPELPAGWLSRVRIQWVRTDSLDPLADGDTVLRLRPLGNQDANLVGGIYFALHTALFPGVKEVIPATPRRAAILQLARRTLLKTHPYAVADLEARYVEPAIKDDPETAYYLGHYGTLDDRGFLTTVFIRELATLAIKVRHSEHRITIAEDLKVILEHLLAFAKTPRAIPDELWQKTTERYSYGFLLVARPYSRITQAYVRRANERADNGVSRLYVLGANQEKSFVRAVIRDISHNTRYVLVELVRANRDYRGEDGGICAVFDIKHAQQKADKEIGDFFED